MPKVYLSEAERRNAIFVRAYESSIATPKMKNYEVAEKAGMPLRTLYSRLKDPSQLRVSELREIVRVTGIPWESVAAFICGSKEVRT